MTSQLYSKSEIIFGRIKSKTLAAEFNIETFPTVAYSLPEEDTWEKFVFLCICLMNIEGLIFQQLGLSSRAVVYTFVSYQCDPGSISGVECEKGLWSPTRSDGLSSFIKN